MATNRQRIKNVVLFNRDTTQLVIQSLDLDHQQLYERRMLALKKSI